MEFLLQEKYVCGPELFYISDYRYMATNDDTFHYDLQNTNIFPYECHMPLELVSTMNETNCCNEMDNDDPKFWNLTLRS